LYKLLFKSKKPIAKQFTDWVCDVIKEVRLNGVYNLEKQLENTNEKLMLKDREIENSLVSNFKNRHAFYLILVEKDIVKFGFTKDIEKRLKDHKVEFGKDIMLKMVIETIHNRELEQMVKLKLQHVIIEKKYKNNQIELIQLSKEFTYEDLKVKIEEIDTSTVPELIKENTELKLKLAENELIIKNYELIKRNIELNKLTEPVKIPQVIKQNQERIQLYDPSNLKLIKTYETIQDACNETEYYKDAIPQSIYRSIKNNTLYKNYRFWKIERSQPIKEYTIPENYELSKEKHTKELSKLKMTK
jgi:predicted GIY-YIG superfamily endonuclease